MPTEPTPRLDGANLRRVHVDGVGAAALAHPGRSCGPEQLFLADGDDCAAVTDVSPCERACDGTRRAGRPVDTATIRRVPVVK
jgi:hypothetical protein